MPMQKIVGQPCPDCGVPFIQGQKGAYCKPCYIRYKNSLNNTQQQPIQPTYVKQEVNQFEAVMTKKADNIAEAQGRKEESIREAGAKRDAGLIVAAMIHSGELKGADWFAEYQEITVKIYNYRISPLFD
jgi:hypothetical protein